MSWLFSQALVEEYWGDTCLDGELSAPLSGSHIQQAYCALDKMTKFSRLSRFGMTYKPLTENRGEELLTLYLEDFRAKTSQLRGGGQDLTEKDQECGEKWHGLLARFDQDSHSWRTVQCSLIGDLNESLQTLPQWGMTVAGELYLRQTLVQTIKEKESGYWLTPTATAISGRSQEAMKYRTQYRESRGHNTVQPGNLAEQVMYSGDIPCKDMKKPTTRDKFPTPLASDWKPRGPNSKQQGLAEVVKMWGTPKAQDSRHALRDRGKGNLGEQVSGLHNGGKLNPLWTEWLMGWPIGWTDLKPLVMDKSRYVQQLHGSYLNE
jgi:hypothetical protein